MTSNIKQKGRPKMSYKKPNTGNSMNNYFTALADFTLLAGKLLTVKNSHSFEIWLNKLEQIDRRSLLIFIRNNKAKIPKKHIAIAQKHFKEVI